MDTQWKILARNDWGEILELSKKKVFQRKFQISESFIELVAQIGFHNVTHIEIAKKCRITRQLVDHHFPDRNSLLLLSYRYIYARLQKNAAEAVVVRKGFRKQFEAYISSVAQWIDTYPFDARFLVQFYAVIPNHPSLLVLHERNTHIGRDRISLLLANARNEQIISNFSDWKLSQIASSIQQQLIGFLILASARSHKTSNSIEAKELLRSSFAIIGIHR